jgi:hypothetical protein
MVDELDVTILSWMNLFDFDRKFNENTSSKKKERSSSQTLQKMGMIKMF